MLYAVAAARRLAGRSVCAEAAFRAGWPAVTPTEPAVVHTTVRATDGAITGARTVSGARALLATGAGRTCRAVLAALREAAARAHRTGTGGERANGLKTRCGTGDAPDVALPEVQRRAYPRGARRGLTVTPVCSEHRGTVGVGCASRVGAGTQRRPDGLNVGHATQGALGRARRAARTSSSPLRSPTLTSAPSVSAAVAHAFARPVAIGLTRAVLVSFATEVLTDGRGARRGAGAAHETLRDGAAGASGSGAAGAGCSGVARMSAKPGASARSREGW